MPSRSLHLALACVVFSACSKPDPLYCDENTPCTDEARPFCDLAGEYPASDGIKRTCIPDPFPDADAGPDTFCTPNEFVECSDLDTAVYCNEAGSEHISLDCGGPCDAAQDGCQCEADTSTCADNLTIHCGASGRPAEIESCALGCFSDGTRCVDVDPSNDLAAYLDMTDDAPIVVLSNGAVIDTDAGTIENGDGTEIDVPDFQVPAPSSGVPLRVFAVKSLTVGDALVTGSRALVVVADGDIIIAGHVRLEAGSVATGNCVGGTADACTGQLESIICGGGGGGGFGTQGGNGGDAEDTDDDVDSGGGTGGFSAGTPALVPIRGGCAGGESTFDAAPGAGGGALQLVSRTRIVVDDSNGESFLNANGGGGLGTHGGGSGGGILLEAPRVVVASATGIVANGGGGGCYTDPGDAGLLSRSTAGGGSCTGAYSAGGDGAARNDTEAEDGVSISRTSTAIAGAGGGGVGRIRVNTPSAVDFVESGVVSPAASTGVLGTR